MRKAEIATETLQHLLLCRRKMDVFHILTINKPILFISSFILRRILHAKWDGTWHKRGGVHNGSVGEFGYWQRVWKKTLREPEWILYIALFHFIYSSNGLQAALFDLASVLRVRSVATSRGAVGTASLWEEGSVIRSKTHTHPTILTYVQWTRPNLLRIMSRTARLRHTDSA
jgi:hypothetical protein